MLRRALLTLTGTVAGGLVAAVALAAVLLATAPGHRALRGWAVRALTGTIDGTVTIGSVGGKLWRAADVKGIELATRDGRPVIRAERVTVAFALADLARGRFRFSRITLVRPVLILEQGADRHWNIDRLFRRIDRDTTPGGPRPLVDLRDVTLVDGTIIVRHRSADTLVERTFTGVTARLPRLRASHPDSAGVAAEFRDLAVRIANPSLDVRSADGDALVDGDSVRFTLDHVELPGTSASLAGRVRWGGSHLAMDVSANAARLAFADLHRLLPDLPADGGGRIAARLRMPGDGGFEFDLRDADLRAGRSAARGTARVTKGPQGGVSLRDVDLAFAPLDLALLEPYVDALPVHGLIAGRLRAGGNVRDLMVDGDLTWRDAEAGGVVNAVNGHGRLALGGASQVVFHAFALRRAEFDFATIARFVPGFEWNGRLRAEGSLEGDWRHAAFSGRLDHLGEPDRATSARGVVRLALDAAVRLDIDLDVDSLSLELLQRTYAFIPVGGTLAGKLALHGPVEGLAVSATLKGPGGAVSAAGTVGSTDTMLTVSLAGTFDSLDLERWHTALPPSALWGAWSADLRVPRDSTVLTTGTTRFLVRPSRLTGLSVSSGAAVLRLTAERYEVDSLRLATAAGPVSAEGTFGRIPAASGALAVSVRADTLAYLEPLVRWAVRARGDSSEVRLDGPGLLHGRITGSADAWVWSGELFAGGATYGTSGGMGLRLQGRAGYDSLGTALDLTGAADSITWAGLGYAPFGLSLAGRVDSLAVTMSAGFGATSAIRFGAHTWSDSVRRVVRLDSLRLDLPLQSWQLTHAVTITVDSETVGVDTLELRPDRGTGRLRAQGVLPVGGVGDFLLTGDSVPVVDVYSLLERDTTGVGGAVDLALRIAGPAATPTMEAGIALLDGRFGDYRVPLAQALLRYGDGRLTLKGGLWRDSVRVMGLSGSLPLDLALAAVPKRRLPGPLSFVAQSDSVDLAVLDPLTDILTGMSGTLQANIRVSGTWDDPALAGFAEMRNGVMTVPALGARYGGMDVRLDLSGSTITVTRATARAGGTLEVAGEVRLDGTRPIVDLTLRTRGFEAFDIRDYGGLTATGDLTLRGPLIGSTLAGRLRADRGYLKFADLVEKRIVSLDDPEFRAIVDSNLAEASALGPEFRTLFADSLRVDSLVVAMGPDVWLRSGEADIQLDGDFVVDRWIESGIPRYRMNGTLRAVRGVYRLVLGPTNSPFQVTKDFRVTRGTVRFYGTPDFNPEMDIAAEHVLRTASATQMTVRALIGGTLLYPRLRLESDHRPPLTETEIVSYMLFGRPPSELSGSGSSSGGGELGILQSTVSGVAGGFGQAVLSDLGLPLDYLTIQTGSRRPNDALGLSTARIGAGVQVNDRTFLTLTAGLCEVMTSQLIGASVEYRLGRPWTASAAFEPLIPECGVASSLSGLSSRYQLSFDLFWQQGMR